jgi:hypothetical protein
MIVVVSMNCPGSFTTTVVGDYETNTFDDHVEFYIEHNLQTNGIAMGTKVGPAFACLIMGFLEEHII